jgi:WD40 repeat protein/serine/threonine protein kinase/TPR repeat protein
VGDRTDLAAARDEKVRASVSNHTWQKVEQLLHEALTLAEEQRAAFLDVACGSDEGLRTELESLLLVGDEMSADYLKSPLLGELGRDIEPFRPASALSAGQLFAQRYELIRELGEGGMGQVWLAAQTSPVRRHVALKLIKAGMYDEAVVQRFRSEGQSLAIMDHPAIARVFDAGTTPQGQPYLVMEYVPGIPITDYCDQHALSIRERLELFIHACEGVQHAHQKAIMHRDLKPSNILVFEVDGKPTPRIIDFGLAKTTAPRVAGESLFTQWGQFLGTPGYMSPEQVNLDARDIDTRTDVYSLGVVLYVLLTGLQPFETKRRQKRPLDELLRQLREDEPPAPSTKVSADGGASTANAATRGADIKHLVKQLRGDLDWITMKALERDRERRYAAPSELAADLRRYLNDEPVLARSGGPVYQVLKFTRRHRAAAGFMGIVTVLSIVASTAALIALRQKHEAQFQTTQALQAQSRLLTEAAAQRLKTLDVVGAQGLILEALTNPAFARSRTPASVSVFQEIRAADVQLAVLSGHREIVFSAAYSPDGTRIVTASRDQTARIWDARTGVQLGVLSGHNDRVNFAKYSPDGTRIVTASYDGTARIWDARTGTQLAVLPGHGHEFLFAGYSPDGTRIVTAGADKNARIWDAQSDAQLIVLSGHGDKVYSAAYSPDGLRIVTASWDKTARIWDARTGVQLAVLSGHSDRVSSAAYSPDGLRIVTASWDKTARIWDARTGALLAVLTGHSDAVSSANYSPDGTRIVTSSWDKTAGIWDALTGAQLAVIAGHADIVYSALYSPDGTRILTASWDKTARIWYTRSDAQLAVLTGNDRVYSAAYSPGGNRIVTASEDKTARVLDSGTGVQLVVLSGHEDRVFSATYSPDGSRIVTASNDKTARIWEASTGAQLAVMSGHTDGVRFAAYSPDGTHIVTASFDKTARIWDARSGVQVALLAGHRDIVYSAAYSPEGTHIVTASRDKTARIWDARTGAQLTVLAVPGDYVESAAYSPDGTRIVTASYDRTAGIWDARSGLLLTVLSGHGDIVFSAAYSPDGNRIVTASRDKTIRVWDGRTGAQLAVLSGHGDAAASAVYSPDGNHIVSAAADKTARIWDARVQASVEAQIMWDAAAQADLLPAVDRTRLGLPPDAPIKSWPARSSSCDQAAAAVYDPDRLASGTMRDDILVDIASPACSAEIGQPQHFARLDYQMGRTLFAKGEWGKARQRLESAVSRGYRAARIDLADLLVSPAAKMRDPGRAVSLYETAWQEGVAIAAFSLAHLYEYGLQASDAPGTSAFHADISKAWLWYQKAADAGEPNALARFAERDDQNALAEADPARRNALWLQAFTRYATAAAGAHHEDWPDEIWKRWRYRRATLARLLAHEGMMQQVGDAYGEVVAKRYPEATWWEQIKNTIQRGSHWLSGTADVDRYLLSGSPQIRSWRLWAKPSALSLSCYARLPRRRRARAR